MSCGSDGSATAPSRSRWVNGGYVWVSRMVWPILYTWEEALAVMVGGWDSLLGRRLEAQLRERRWVRSKRPGHLGTGVR